MVQKDYDSVCRDFRLADGRLWSIPIVFDVDEATKNELEKKGGDLLIQDARGVTRAILHVQDIFEPNKDTEGKLVYGGNPDHCEIVNINTNI
jgi:sulfate adenylyltransferase